MKKFSAVLAGVAATVGYTLALAAPPKFDHVVIVVMENESRSAIIGNSKAPYINSLANQGANLTNYHAITHPSQPNYIAMFSGSTHGIKNDDCGINLGTTANLANQLFIAGKTFIGYADSMPKNGYTGCSSGNYQRKHNPWVNFSNVPSSSNLTFKSFPTDYTKLPTVSMVVPDMCHDMHDCSIATGDTWLNNNIDKYAQWAKKHNSLLVLTWDEDDDDHGSKSNQIATIFVGANVKVGTNATWYNHYSLLRTLEDMYGLAPLKNAAIASPIDDIWKNSNRYHFPRSALGRGQTLFHNQWLTSESGEYNLYFQDDGNLVLLQGQTRTVWESGTRKLGGTKLVMQDDGNLVMYTINGKKAVWNTGTNGKNATRAVLQNDGKFVLQNSSGNTVWGTSKAQ